MICFDANVLIEIILGRKNAKKCQQYIDLAKEDMAITVLSLDLIMYYAERNKLDLVYIEQFMRLFIWLPMTDTDAEWAFKQYAADDYEDALQIGCALRERCARFVTLDQGLKKKYAQKLQIDLLA